MFRFALTSLLLAASVEAVDRSNFRTCKDTGFCRRHRATAAPPKFKVLKDSITSLGLEGLTGILQGELLDSPPLKLSVKFYESGVARLQIREANPATPRWEAPDSVLGDQLNPVSHEMLKDEDAARVKYADGHELVINFDPFSATLFANGTATVTANGQNQFYFEYHRSRQGAPALAAPTGGDEDKHKGKKIVGYWEDGLAIYEDGSREEKDEAELAPPADHLDAEGGGFWEESFGGHQDSKPYGPSSVGMDLSFPGSSRLYGLPISASGMTLKTTTGPDSHYKEPYRVYTLGVSEDELDEPMALYGSIPMIMSHSADTGSVGVFWLNPSETFVDVSQDAAGTSTHWMSESGVVDLMFLPGVVLYEKGFVEREDVARADAFLRDLARALAAVAPALGRAPAVARQDSAGRPNRVYADAAAVASARAVNKQKNGTVGRNEVALVVMTMDDVPLLSRWLIYHGHVFGFENLYVFDGSRGAQKEYLERAREQFPINVRHSLVSLNQITGELAAWMDEIKGRYEWMMKVDTDEFVAFAQPNGSPDVSSPNLHLPPGATAAALLGVHWVASVAPVQSGSPTESERANIVKGDKFKQIYSGPQFQKKNLNLGSHCLKCTGTARGLLVVHYHWRSYEELVRLATQTIISHGYISAAMNVSAKISKLAKLDLRPKCDMASCHKNWIVLDDLRDHEKMRSQFYEAYGSYPSALREYRDYLREIFPLYPSLLRPYRGDF